MTSVSADRRFGVNSGMAIKVPCKAATTGNITLSGEQTIDGVSCVTGDRVLVKNQTSLVNNGIYRVDTGAWSRDADCDGAYDVVHGTLFTVHSGTVNSNTVWKISANDPITIGSSSLSIVGALFNDASTISFTQAGTGAVSRTAQAKLRERVSVADFGAVGDGVTNDAPAIANAIASLTNGGELIFENGKNYLCSTAIVNASTIPQSIKFIGGGAGVLGASGGTRITYSGAAKCFDIQFNVGYASIGGWEFEGIEFNCTNVAGTMFQWNDYTASPIAATPPRTLRQIKYSHCTFNGVGGATQSGHAIMAMKVFELVIDATCEFNSWQTALKMKGCDNVVVDARFQDNVIHIEHIRSGSYGNNLRGSPKLLAPNLLTGGTAYLYYSTGFEDTLESPYFEGGTNGGMLYLNGNSQNIIAPWMSLGGNTAPNNVMLATGSALANCNIIYPKLTASATATMTLANSVEQLTVHKPSIYWLNSVAGSLPNPVIRFTGLDKSYGYAYPVNDEDATVTINGATNGRTFQLTPWQSPVASLAGQFSVIADAGGYFGYALKATAGAGSVGGGITLICGKHFGIGETLKLSARYRMSGVRAAGTSRFQIQKNGANLINFAIPDSTTYTTYSLHTGVSVPTTGFVLGDTLTFNVYNNGSDVDLFVAAATIEVCPYLQDSGTWNPALVAAGAISATTTVTVAGAALGDFVEPSFSLDLQGLDLRGYVSAANTVTCYLKNDTGAGIDLASGTLTARVLKL